MLELHGASEGVIFVSRAIPYHWDKVIDDVDNDYEIVHGADQSYGATGSAGEERGREGEKKHARAQRNESALSQVSIDLENGSNKKNWLKYST